MNTIPEELQEQLEQGNVLLFIGERIVHDAAGDVAFDQLAAQLVVRAGIADGEGISFPEIAQLYEDEKGSHELLRFVKGYFEGLGNRPQPVHHLIAGLTDCMVLATTCFDGRLERAFEEAERPLKPIIGNVDVAFEEQHHTQLYKLRGSLERIESLILTEDAYETFFEQHASISLVLQGYLARKTILFVGYDLTDPHFKRLYRKVTAPLDHFTRRAYAFGAALPAHIASWAKRRQIELISADVMPFLESLTAQLAARKAAAPWFLSLSKDDKLSAQPEPLPERPYKFLDYYEAKDAGIFYGRQQETQHLCALIHAHRLVLLYGASGVGKTSLLLAGAVPRLERATPPYETIYIRALEDPTLVIRRTLRRQLPDANLPDEGSLVDFLSAVTTELGQSLVIILDQFEEFFIRLSPQFRAAFISELGALYDARDVPVKVLFSLREDWLASMDEIEARIPDLFRTRMRVSRLTGTQAHQAITAPVERLGLSYEPALLERLLADLLGSNQEVMPPQLQLICSALYDGRREDDRVLKVATYERLGGVQGVLHRYLEEELSRLDPIEQTLARAILEELVTSEKTKAVKSSAELALRLEVKLRILVPLLEWLVRGRLLRALKQETGQRAYELAHEYLIHEISLTADSQARKQAEELLQQEIENWQRFGTVLAADKLAIVNDVRDVLRLNDDAQALLLHSTLQVGQDIEYWLNRIPEPTRRAELLTQATQNKLTIVRQRAAETLGTQDVPESVEPLLALALHDSNMDVRDTARQSLAQLTTQHIEILERLKDEVERSAQAENPTASTRAAVLRTLTYLPLSSLPLSLRMQVLAMRIRLYVTWLIEISTTTPQGRALALTTGLLIAVAAITYTFAANSYYVSLAAPDIRDTPINITISQGRSWLPPMGLEQEWVDSGISETQIEDALQSKVRNEELEGFWTEPDEGDYRQWGKQVSEVLKLEHRTQMLWYLGEKEEALQAILAALSSQDTELQQRSAVLLEQIVVVEPQLVEANPQLTQEFFDVLPSLLNYKDLYQRYNPAYAVGEVVKANPQLAKQTLSALLPLLEHEGSNVRDRAAFAVGLVVKADPQLLTEQVMPALLPLLSDEDRKVRGSATSAIREVGEANPQLLTEQLLRLLLRLLSDEDWDVPRSTMSIVAQVVEANPQLAEQVIDELLARFSDEEWDVRYNAVSGVGQLVESNPQLAQQVMGRLLGLIDNDKSDLRASAVSAIGQLVESNSEFLTEQEQLMATLLSLLKDEARDVRASAASAVGQVVEANPQLPNEQVMPALLLLLLLEDEHSNVRANATSAVGQVGEANPELVTEDVIAALLPLLEPKEDGGFSHNAIHALDKLVAVKPELAQLYLDRLFDLIYNSSSSSSGWSYSLGQVLAPNPQLAQQHLGKLFDLLSDPNLSIYREGLTSSLAQVLTANSELAQQKHLEKVVDESLSTDLTFNYSIDLFLIHIRDMLAINP